MQFSFLVTYPYKAQRQKTQLFYFSTHPIKPSQYQEVKYGHNILIQY